ncbi:MAG: FKBP-type peptidyl-prolyl cis-trans isomerase [Prevotella sp.]|nr:FKBP-type peptidyl-prolyl cis-trans isomerase [Prevotella sp.]
MKQFISILSVFCLAFCLSTSLVSCSEEDDSVEEFPNWQEANENYFNNLFTEVQKRISAGDTSWRLIRQWSLQDSLSLGPESYVIAHVLESGSGRQPLYSDTVFVHYQGRLLPSTSYPTGYVFEQTWYNSYDPTTMRPQKMGVSQTVSYTYSSSTGTYSASTSSNIDGFTTALMDMHVGDRWEIYIPYALGYGTTANNSIPAYSTLIFDLTLSACYRAGESVPAIK